MISPECKEKSFLFYALLFILLILLMTGCRNGDPLSSIGYKVEENRRDDQSSYPYLVRTESSTWYLAKEDIELLGEEAYYAGIAALLPDMEQDFADAREALTGYLPDDIPPIDIYTDFCGKAGISETAGAYYNVRSNFIKLFCDWDMAKEALLHEYVHYLTIHCTQKPTPEGFWAEGLAEYISKIVCKNRMLRSINMGLSDEEAFFYQEHGAWDESEGCIDPKLFYFGTAQVIAQGALVGMDYFSVSDITITRTPQIQQHPRADTVSHIEAACIVAYLVDTYSRDRVFSSWDTAPEEMESTFGKPFENIYQEWTAWNARQWEKFGLH